MIIEIRKAGFVNKGAELMLIAIVQKLKERYPNAVLTMTTTGKNGSQPFRKVVDIGAYPKASLRVQRIQCGRLARFIPKKFREMYGLILDQEVDVVIDAAGFAYSSEWGKGSALELARAARGWRRQGTKVVLMPQAFGPYKGSRIRRAMECAFENCDLVMPRDETSRHHLEEICGASPKIRQYSDFTNLVNGVVPNYFDRHKHQVCLVPNYQMIAKSDKSIANAYLPFMVHCAKRLKEISREPFLLVHEGQNDRWLAEKISKEAGGVPVLIENDAAKTKGIIGSSYAVIGSRFHSLVSALSQGVPSFSTGWSHKYSHLFNDYGVVNGVVPLTLERASLNKRIQGLVEPHFNQAAREELAARSSRLKALSEDMWAEVFYVIDGAEIL